HVGLGSDALHVARHLVVEVGLPRRLVVGGRRRDRRGHHLLGLFLVAGRQRQHQARCQRQGLDQFHVGTPFGRCGGGRTQQASLRHSASSASATAAGTKPETSPPRREISRTSDEEMKPYCSAGVRNRVSTSGMRWRFMLAIWNSYSKSETARSP